MSKQGNTVPPPQFGPGRTYPDDLGPAIQAELAALADVEVRYERMAERVQDRPSAKRDHLIRRLSARREAARKAHISRLHELQQRLIAAGFIRPDVLH
jgi:hypothetical protein